MRLFDLHCDTLYECYFTRQSLLSNRLHIDLLRGSRFDSWAQIFAVWMPDDLRGQEALLQCRGILEFAHNQAEANAERLTVVRTAGDLEQAVRNHRCAAILSVEGGSALAGRLETLDELKKSDVKLITLTWNGSNELGHGSLSGCPDGLTDFGKKAVARMEELQILPDVSHLNEKGFWDVVDCAKGAVVASHSLSAEVHAHPRNLTDRQFCAIRDKGGLVGLNLCGHFLGEQTLQCLERHLYHYLSLGGEKAVAFGCDFDGTDLPEAWGGIQIMETIYGFLQSKNYEERLLDGLFFSNCYDFFKNARHGFDN